MVAAAASTRTLTLLRHAKSSWSSAATTDHERPLNDRGRRNAPEMAQRMRAAGIPIDKVLCSDARRTQETAALMLPILGVDTRRLTLEPRLYDAPLSRLLTVVGEQTDDALLLIAHNPGLEMLSAALAPGAINRMPTCAVVSLRFPAGPWASLIDQALDGFPAEPVWVDTPKRGR